MDFDTSLRWRLDDKVAVRPEPFGALAYHYGSRRLTFLRSRLLAEVVSALGDYESAVAALDERVPAPSRPTYERALADLARSEFIRAC